MSQSFWQKLFGKKTAPAAPHTEMRVAADRTRCVQCGVCGYNCPVGIPVRDYARQGLIVTDPRCVQCGQCIEACPRGTLRWSRASLRSASEEDLFAELMEPFAAAAESKEEGTA